MPLITLSCAVTPCTSAWSPRTKMPSVVAPSTVKPRIVTFGASTVKALLPPSTSESGEASSASGWTVAPPRPIRVAGLETTTSSVYVPGQTSTTPPAETASRPALIVGYAYGPPQPCPSEGPTTARPPKNGRAAPEKPCVGVAVDESVVVPAVADGGAGSAGAGAVGIAEPRGGTPRPLPAPAVAAKTPTTRTRSAA